MERQELIELMERLPVALEVSDKDYRSVAVPCFPFPEEKSLAQEMSDGVDLLAAA